MRKLWIVLIILSLLLCSCQNITRGGPNTDEGINPPADDDPVEEVTTYEDIERRRVTSYKANYYSLKNDSTLLKISLPTEWTLSEAADNGFDIFRDGETVGYLISAPADDMSAWTVLKTETRSVADVCVTKYIEEKNGYKDYRYRYVYNYTSDGCTRTVTLTADCAEINEKTEKKLYTDITTHEKSVSETVGTLSSLSNASSILILGNSFISSSKIGSILREMLGNNGKDCEVDAISRGNATVKTYISDEPLLDRIREGRYDAVFICGFYNMAQIDYLGVLKEACDVSMTKLIIFPAHNENSSVVASVQSKYPSLFLLNWKAEIDNLIIKGVDRWDLCEDDSCNHSKPLAGYVGAHMIYRSIYGEVPPEPVQHLLSQDYIDGVLGDYAYKGDLKVVDEDKIMYFD